MNHRLLRVGAKLVPPSVQARRVEERLRAETEAAERRRVERVAARRRALLAGDSAIREIEVAGRSWFGRTMASFTAAGAADHNLELVVAALTHAEIEYFVVPGRSPLRHVLGIRLEARKRLLKALRELYDSGALYAALPTKELLPREAGLYADGALPAAVKRADTIRFGELLLGPDGQLLGSLEFGCDVEFWRDGAQVVGTPRFTELRSQAPVSVVEKGLVAPRLNAVSDVLPEGSATAVRVIAGREHPTFADFVRPRIDEVDFPIDVVYTWVDGSDPELAGRREHFRSGGTAPIHARETGASRYTSHDELRYSLRSLDMYAGFVRTVYLVTDGQTPDWLDQEAAGIKVIHHKEIFADPQVLPVFNSHAIGTQLHRIPGLSQRYLYFNDDVFVGRPIAPGHFFHGNGVAKIPFSPAQLGLGLPHPDEPAPNSAGKNVRRLLMEAHGRFSVHKFMHTPHPQMREVMEEIESRFPAEVQQTSASRFRAVTDIAMGASLHHHQAYLTGRAVPGKFKLRYIDVASEDAFDKMTSLAEERRFDFFCLNDVNTPQDRQEEIARRMSDFLQSYFPFPSRFERKG
ncbi:sugar phosphotransferase [Streptomyces dioscori]|uniref:Sugar phosphotransferase n=1 Tax=Streptomyces dioscori TaxID=2109333 RepID=A0A2P8Q1U6_9ACTN|nr:stealth family protein [Streptomyces dioscori]PSM40221.1 sugar phosphotransferase [Streptomyces dioscori]